MIVCIIGGFVKCGINGAQLSKYMLITTIFDKNGSDNNNIVNRLTNEEEE